MPALSICCRALNDNHCADLWITNATPLREGGVLMQLLCCGPAQKCVKHLLSPASRARAAGLNSAVRPSVECEVFPPRGARPY